RRRRAELARLVSAAERSAELEPLLAGTAAATSAAVAAHQRLVDEHQRAMEARLAGMAAELAAGLTDAAPCPVCGSAVHPQPAVAAADAAPVTAADVAAARERRGAPPAARGGARHGHPHPAQPGPPR